MEIEKTTTDTSLWVQDYADYLFSFAVSRLNDEDLAKDLVQDTFIAGMQGLDNFKGNSSIKTWLVSILKRKIIDVWRQKESRKTDTFSNYFNKGFMGEHWLEHQQPKGRIAEIEKTLENDELKVAISQCMQHLPAKYKSVFMDKMIDEKDSEEICKENDITSSNFWVIIHRAKLQMRECLENTWFND